MQKVTTVSRLLMWSWYVGVYKVTRVSSLIHLPIVIELLVEVVNDILRPNEIEREADDL